MTQDACLVYISSSAITTTDPIVAIDQLRLLTNNIELTGGGTYDPQLLSRLVAAQLTQPVNLLIHSYFPPPQVDFVLNFADPGVSTRAFISRSMEYVQVLGVPYYSVHAGFRRDFLADGSGLLHVHNNRIFSLAGIRENVSWFRKNWPNTPLALENMYPNNGNTTCAYMMSLEEICEVLDAIPDIFLLLDLGHLKVSANLLGFDFLIAANFIFQHYNRRIIEIHLSENMGIQDDHLPITASSLQYLLIQEWADAIREKQIRVTLETRGTSLETVKFSYDLMARLVIHGMREQSTLPIQ